MQGVIETVKDFFSPAWLVDLFKGNQRSQAVEIEDADDEDENNEVLQTIEESSSSNPNVRSSSVPSEVSTTSKVGNGQLRSSFGPGYFSSVLREREISRDTPSTSRPSRTFGLSSGFDRLGEPSTSSARSEEFESEVPCSRRETESVQLDTVVVSLSHSYCSSTINIAFVSCLDGDNGRVMIMALLLTELKICFVQVLCPNCN